MTNVPLYPEAKPVDGDALILCEGDVTGYETGLLKLWADSTDLGGRFVKVLACGTGEALYGVADAFGRTIPIIVIEDRDFRTVEEARNECDKKLRNREGRNVAMRGWFAWERAEIENYFTDDEVLPPVFADAFGCSQDEVREAVASALLHLPVTQALEFALFRARKSWQSTDTNRKLRVECVRWDQNGQTALSAKTVRDKLAARLAKWQISLHNGDTWKDPMAGEQLLDDFDTKCEEWNGLDYADATWRRDWAGKEVIKHVRMTLAQASAGWWSLPEAKATAVNWKGMPDKARDAHDRTIERTIQPQLVKAVAERVRTDAAFDLRTELDGLAALIRA